MINSKKELNDLLLNHFKNSILNKVKMNNFEVEKIRFHKNNIKELKMDKYLMLKKDVKNLVNISNLLNKYDEEFYKNIMNSIQEIKYSYKRPTFRGEELNEKYSKYEMYEFEKGLICLYEIQPVERVEIINQIKSETIDLHIKEQEKAIKEAEEKGINFNLDDLKYSSRDVQINVMNDILYNNVKTTKEISHYTLEYLFIFKFKDE